MLNLGRLQLSSIRLSGIAAITIVNLLLDSSNSLLVEGRVFKHYKGWVRIQYRLAETLDLRNVSSSRVRPLVSGYKKKTIKSSKKIHPQ